MIKTVKRKEKDTQPDPYDYPDNPREQNKLLSGIVIAFLIEGIVCLGIIHLIQKYGDVIDNIFK